MSGDQHIALEFDFAKGIGFHGHDPIVLGQVIGCGVVDAVDRAARIEVGDQTLSFLW